jgi:hypothetical protein
VRGDAGGKIASYRLADKISSLTPDHRTIMPSQYYNGMIGERHGLTRPAS